MTTKVFLVGLIIGIIYKCSETNALQGYYGVKIGKLTELHHGVSGEVYAVDSRTLFLKDFNYDGEGPAAYFYVGNSNKPTNEGAFRVRDERGSAGVLRRYRHKDITLSLPEGKTLRDIKWFSVWCDDFSVNFGDVKIPKNLELPRPQKVSQLAGVHGVASDNIVIVDAQTLLIPNFSYDGEAPDAKFWVGRGPKPSPNGLRIPDENGKEIPLRRYDKKTIVLTLPGDLTVYDIGHFGVWCEAFTVDFGHVQIPENLLVPPSLKMLGISPQSKLNCEVLYDDLAFEVRWAVAGESVVIQLVAKLEDGEYMSFGISPDLDHSVMIGADVTVAWVEKLTGKGFAYDYYLDAKSQCSGNRGSCPDNRLDDNTNSVRLLNAALVNGYSIVTYQRPLRAADKFDHSILVNQSQAIIWAIGPLNQRYEVSYHSNFLRSDKSIDFGRQPYWNCPTPENDMPKQKEESYERDRRPQPRPQSQAQPERKPSAGQYEAERRGSSQYQSEKKQQEVAPARRPVNTPRPAPKNGAWDIPPIQCYEPEDGVFYAQMGPTGGKHGYPAITGHVGWGISWYINGLLIPEINVVRGKTYTFVVEGGNDPETPAKYHPFYITDDSVGGYEHKTDEEKENIRIFAGVHRSRNGNVTPIGVGRLCNWSPNQDGPLADEFNSFGAYQRTLTLKCDEGEPGVITWTPDDNTPDTVYYQCFTHRYLGWKINVLDGCDNAQASELDEVFAEPEYADEEMAAEASIRHETKVLPNGNFLKQHEKDLIKHHNMNGSPPKVQFELQKSAEISKLIAEGIRAAEELEETINNNKTAAQILLGQQQQQQLKQHQQMQAGGYAAYKDQMRGGANDEQKFMHLPSMLPPGSGLPVFLRPPQSNPLMFRQVKLPARRPIGMERRPLNRPQRPVILPQPSMIVNHYKKPMNPYMRPYVKTKQLPIKALAPVMMLGQPIEIQHLPQASQPQPQIQAAPPQKYNKSPDVIIGRPPKAAGVDLPPNFNIKKSVETPVVAPRTEKRPYKPIVEKNMPRKSFSDPYEINLKAEPIKPSENTGFKPDSVVVESGFKPIVRRRDENVEDEMEDEKAPLFERRRDDVAIEIDEAIEGDTPFANQEPQSKFFEPMFIPSPPDSMSAAALAKKNPPMMASLIDRVDTLSGDLREMNVEEGEDKMALAAEKLDSFYLPPDNKKAASKIYPEGSVVTFDGKAVLDTSLLTTGPVGISEKREKLDKLGRSQTEKLIRDTPQFGPFRGEIPPLVSEFLSSDSGSPQFTKPPVSEYMNPLTKNVENKPISTKLTAVQPKFSGQDEEDKSNETKQRTKRSAHHTPEHTGTGDEDEGHEHHHHQNHDRAMAAAAHTHLPALLLIVSSSCYLLLNKFW